MQVFQEPRRTQCCIWRSVPVTKKPKYFLCNYMFNFAGFVFLAFFFLERNNLEGRAVAKASGLRLASIWFSRGSAVPVESLGTKFQL